MTRWAQRAPEVVSARILGLRASIADDDTSRLANPSDHFADSVITQSPAVLSPDAKRFRVEHESVTFRPWHRSQEFREFLRHWQDPVLVALLMFACDQEHWVRIVDVDDAQLTGIRPVKLRRFLQT